MLTFNIVHHLDGEQIARPGAADPRSLRPGGTWAVLDYFKPDSGRGSGAQRLLGLFFFLTSSAATYRESEIRGWMSGAGFASTRRVPIRRLPDFQLWEARKYCYSPMALR